MTPQEDESLLGYIKRRSEAEGFPDAGGFMTMLGRTYGRATFEDPSQLAKDLEIRFPVLEAMLPASQPTDPALTWSFHRMHRDPVCPTCIAARQPRRKEWRHALVTACAIHECRLIDICPSCLTPLTLTGDRYSECLCGAGYGGVQVKLATPLEIQVARLLAGRSARLAGVDLNRDEALNTVRLIWFLCTNMVPARTGKEGKATYPKSISEAHAFLSRVEPLLQEWPQAFDSHVAQRWDAPGADGQTAAARLGPWYRGLLSQKGRLAKELRSRCLGVVATVCGDAYKTKRRHDDADWLSAAQAGEMLGIRSERIVEAVRSGTIEGKQGRSGTGHTHTIVKACDIESIHTLRMKAATKNQVREALGVSRKQFDLMEEVRFFDERCLMPRHTCVDGSYNLDQILQLNKRICEGGDGDRAATGRTISFREINLRRTTDRKALLQIYGLIAKQKISPVSSEEGGRLGDVQFDADVIDRHLQQQGGARSWTAADVAKFTGWKPECITGWCEQGLMLATKGKRGALDVWQISEKALAAFQREFLVVSDLAKEGGTSSRRILASLELHGITLIGSQPSGASSRGHLIRTCHLSRILAAS